MLSKLAHLRGGELPYLDDSNLAPDGYLCFAYLAYIQGHSLPQDDTTLKSIMASCAGTYLDQSVQKEAVGRWAILTLFCETGVLPPGFFDFLLPDFRGLCTA